MYKKHFINSLKTMQHKLLHSFLGNLYLVVRLFF
jgi:hypothetical protein